MISRTKTKKKPAPKKAPKKPKTKRKSRADKEFDQQKDIQVELSEASKQDGKEGERLKNPRHELFCVSYATRKEFFGNGTKSYIEAYNRPNNNEREYRVAQVNASNLLSNPIICERIAELLEYHEGLSDVEVDKQRAYLIRQMENLPVKERAIESYDKVKKRIDPGGNMNISFSLTDVHRRARQKHREDKEHE